MKKQPRVLTVTHTFANGVKMTDEEFRKNPPMIPVDCGYYQVAVSLYLAIQARKLRDK